MAEGTVRQYFAASAGRNAYEGVTLRYLVQQYLAEGLSASTRVTVKSPDGYAKQVDLSQLSGGIGSLYQPGETRDILLAHLSKENNTPELAEYAVARALQSAGLSVRLGVAPRDTMSEVHLCRRSPSFASAN